MIILGCDISLNSSGISIINTELDNIIHYQTITHPNKYSFTEKLKNIDSVVNLLLNDYQIDMIVIEDVYMGINKKTFKQLSLVHGIFLANIVRKDIPYVYFSTNEMKKAILGKIPKKVDTKKLVADEIFKLYPNLPQNVSNDITDSIALILTYMRL